MHLSDLDAYGKELALRYFKNGVDREPVQFEYGYDLFLRWLLTYAFIVLGWANTSNSDGIEHTVNLVSTDFGAVPLGKGEREVLLDPARSKLDYLTHKTYQARLNPHRVVKIEDVRRFAPDAREIPAVRLPVLKRGYNKSALITLTLDDPRIAVYASEQIHPDLVVRVFPFDQPQRVLQNSRAIARIKRRRLKTYVDIIDLYELDAPFVSGEMGTIQSDENWSAWRKAIEDNDNFVLVGTLPADLKYENIEFVSKIKVSSIEE